MGRGREEEGGRRRKREEGEGGRGREREEGEEGGGPALFIRPAVVAASIGSYFIHLPSTWRGKGLTRREDSILPLPSLSPLSETLHPKASCSPPQ
jgi:hypothetical protein